MSEILYITAMCPRCGSTSTYSEGAEKWVCPNAECTVMYFVPEASS